MLQKLKDTVLSKGAKAALNTQIKAYGKMLTLNLNSKEKSLTFEVLLEGEKDVLTVEVGRYELYKAEEKHLLKIYDVQTSRAWINTLIQSYLEGKAFEIPKEYAKILGMVI